MVHASRAATHVTHGKHSRSLPALQGSSEVRVDERVPELAFAVHRQGVEDNFRHVFWQGTLSNSHGVRAVATIGIAIARRRGQKMFDRYVFRTPNRDLCTEPSVANRRHANIKCRDPAARHKCHRREAEGTDNRAGEPTCEGLKGSSMYTLEMTSRMMSKASTVSSSTRWLSRSARNLRQRASSGLC